MTAVLHAAKKALPPAPAGWVIVGDDQEARNKIIADAAAASVAALKLKQPRLDAAMAKVSAIVKKQVALVEKGDMAGAQALILIGQWQATPEGIWKRVRHPELAPTAAQVISIRITADPGRLAATIGAIDVKSLAAKVPN